jgi:hypothetical protein
MSPLSIKCYPNFLHLQDLPPHWLDINHSHYNEDYTIKCLEGKLVYSLNTGCFGVLTRVRSGRDWLEACIVWEEFNHVSDFFLLCLLDVKSPVRFANHPDFDKEIL